MLACLKLSSDMTEPVNTLAYAFVTSHIDYCNSLLSSVPKKVMDKLRHVRWTNSLEFSA